MPLNRRLFMLSAPAALAGCVTDQSSDVANLPNPFATHHGMYGAIETEPFPVPAIDLSEIDGASARPGDRRAKATSPVPR